MTDVTTPEMPAPTVEQVEQSYKAAMDSVNLLKAGKPENMSDKDWSDCFARNVEHLQIQIAKGSAFYGSNDLTPFTQAVALPAPTVA
jgi:hypothetical protein